jgi:hypothetical protein
MKTETTTPRSSQFSWLATALLGLSIIQITGCADVQSTPEGSSAMKQQALSFAPPPGKACIYVIRPYHFYNDSYYGHSGNPFNISLDYQAFGSLDVNSYLFGVVPPGKHILGSSDTDMFDPGSNSGSFIAEAGKNYYFTATGVGATRFRHLQIESISEIDGQAYVRKFKLSGDTRSELQNPNSK